MRGNEKKKRVGRKKVWARREDGNVVILIQVVPVNIEFLMIEKVLARWLGVVRTAELTGKTMGWSG